MTESNSTTFMERHFGDFSEACESAFVEAGSEAHARSLDAKVASQLKSNHAYGSTFWLALPEEVVSRLVNILPGATAFPPKGAQYDLLVWDEIAVLAVKVMEDGRRGGMLRARVSDLRTRLARVNGPASPQATLFDDAEVNLDGSTEEARKIVSAARAAIGNLATRLVIAAYVCNPKSGLQEVRVGIATLDADGTINYRDSQRLSLSQPRETDRLPTLVHSDNFADAPRPKPFLKVVVEDTAASGEVQADNHDGSKPE